MNKTAGTGMRKNRHGELSVNDCRGEEARRLWGSRAMPHTCEVLCRDWPRAPQPHICWLISFSQISKRRFMKLLCQKVFKETRLTWDTREPTHGCRGGSQEQLLSFPCGNCSSGELSRNLLHSPTSSSSTSQVINSMIQNYWMQLQSSVLE